MTPDDINSLSTYNNPGELFGSDVVRRVRRVIPAEPREVFGSSSDDFDTADQSPPEPELPLQRVELAGSFSLLRAARVAHQHRVEFWESNRVLPAIGGSSAPDPSTASLEEQFNDMILNSYLPPSLTPSRAEFEIMSSPTRRLEYLQTLVARLVPPPDDNSATGDVAPVRERARLTPPPFAETVQSKCNQYSLFFRRPSAPLQYTAEDFRTDTRES